MNRLVVAGRAATPLQSGGWLVDLGEAWPRWVSHRDDALDLLDAAADSSKTCHGKAGPATARQGTASQGQHP